jgi:flagellin
MARLSTGKRINSAADDAAGVAIASRLSSEIRGTDQAIRNALDGQALIDTAEGGHKEIEAILQRMREVSIQAASDTNNAQDRGNLQAEVKALITEIDRIAGVTTWAGNSVMDGGGSASKTFSLQVGAATGTKNQIDVAINDMGKAALGLAPGGDKWGQTISAIANGAGVAVDVATSVMTLAGDATADYAADIEGVTITGATNGTADTTKAHRDASAADFVAKINANATLTGKGVKAVAMADAAVMSSAVTGGAGSAAQVVFTSSATLVNLASWEIKGTDANGKSITETVLGAAATATSTNSFLTIDSIKENLVGAGSGTVTVSIGKAGSATTLEGIREDRVTAAGGLEMDGIYVNARIEILHGADDMSSSSKARHAVTVIDAAIKTVNTQRSELGAVSNRLSHTVSNMTNISTNLSAARGGIEDADFAVETTNLAKNQILQQASTAMLAQANASKQNVLSLLQ